MESGSRMKMFGREVSRATQGDTECGCEAGVVLVVLVTFSEGSME